MTIRQVRPRIFQCSAKLSRMALGGILTAMVTPFDDAGRVDEEGTARLVRHLLESGSDGVVVAGTTGEGATLDDDEKCRLFEIAVENAGGATVVAGTGSNDTAHTVHLTERATAIGVDAVLVVTPYYNKPNARGILEHFRATAGATGLPVIAYNIPSRCVVDIPNDLLREIHDEVPQVSAVKQARYEDLEAIDGIDLLAGNDDMLADVMDAGGTGGICVASHLVGGEMRRIIDEPEARHEVQESLAPLLSALSVTTNPMPVKAALNMVGLEVGGFRLPMVDLSEEEAATVRGALEQHGLLSAV
jgi:4-hydroxy-tetrahydrodipicolinate synthase